MTTFGTFGMESEFDSYGINAFHMWYDHEYMIADAVNDDGDFFVGFDSNGDCIEEYHGSGEGPPLALGPMVPRIHGPRSIEDVDDNPYNCYGCMPKTVFISSSNVYYDEPPF